MYWGVEFLKYDLEHPDRPRFPTPWTAGISELVRNERQTCESSLQFCQREHRTSVEQFIADQEALDAGIGRLHSYCSQPGYGVITPIEASIPVAETCADLAGTDPWFKGYDAELVKLKEQFAPIRQALVACRYTAREMYPEYFNVPMVEVPRQEIVAWTSATASHPLTIAKAA
jgi:hypothetical protein